MKDNPKITVVMSTFNRCEMLKESLQSILEQTYKDYELIVIDNGSTDGTRKFLEDVAAKDTRIVYIRNGKTKNYIYNLIRGCKMARGEYIARMDDDDISLPQRFEKQVEFLDHHPDIAVVGTFIRIFGDCGTCASWINNAKPEFCALETFHQCPLCHPTVMMRKSFFEEKNLGYNPEALYAEDITLWIDIILAGGKIANIPEELLKYRWWHARISSDKDLIPRQMEALHKAREKMWRLFFPSSMAKKLSRLNPTYPRLHPIDTEYCNALWQVAEKNSNLFPRETVQEYLTHMGVKSNRMHICFAGDDRIAEKMCVAMTSIVRHARIFDIIDFFVIENDISTENKEKIKKLEKNNVTVEFIRVDVKSFERYTHAGSGCPHVPLQTYFRYFIPRLKPEYEKVLYLDCDIVVRKSLCELWETELGDNYAAVVQEFFRYVGEGMKIKLSKVFNAGVLLLNNRKCVEDNMTKILLDNNDKLIDKTVYGDQDVLNYTFNNRVVWIAPVYNAQIDLWRPGTCTTKPLYNANDMWFARHDPVIVHFNSPNKPWDVDGYDELKKFQPFTDLYFENLKLSPYGQDYRKNISKCGLALQFKLKISYYRYKILSKVTFGKRRKHYKEKRRFYKERIRAVRLFERD